MTVAFIVWPSSAETVTASVRPIPISWELYFVGIGRMKVFNVAALLSCLRTLHSPCISLFDFISSIEVIVFQSSDNIVLRTTPSVATEESIDVLLPT